MWPSREWYGERGYTKKEDYMSKTLPNGWEIAVSTPEPAIPTRPPIEGETLAIVAYEPDGTQTTVTFSMFRDSNIIPELFLSALLKAVEDQILS